MELPCLAEIEKAQRVVYAHMPPTPQYTWPLVNERLGTEAWLKHENHSPVGAFKLRGALVYMESVSYTHLDVYKRQDGRGRRESDSHRWPQRCPE